MIADIGRWVARITTRSAIFPGPSVLHLVELAEKFRTIRRGHVSHVGCETCFHEQLHFALVANPAMTPRSRLGRVPREAVRRLNERALEVHSFLNRMANGKPLPQLMLTLLRCDMIRCFGVIAFTEHLRERRRLGKSFRESPGQRVEVEARGE